MSNIASKDIANFISYCPETGSFTWKKGQGNMKVGDKAGSVHRDGYYYIRLWGRYFPGHRVAWLIMTGDWPVNLVDHKNLDRSDNRWANLRAANHSQNGGNSRGKARSLPKGVVAASHGSLRFCARIRMHGKDTHLGTFDSPAEAHAAYVSAASAHFGEFARFA